MPGTTEAVAETATTTQTTEAASTAASAASTTTAAATTSGTDADRTASDATSAATGATAATTTETPAAAVYDLKLPDGSTLGADFVTRTADIARALGLSNEAGQKLLDAQIAEVQTATTAAVDAAKADQLAAMQPGGSVWVEQEAAWRGKALADAEIGGSPDKLQASVDLALKVVDRFASPDAKQFFTATGLGSHPELVRLFARIGKQMSEATLVRPNATASTAMTEDERLARRYPTMVSTS